VDDFYVCIMNVRQWRWFHANLGRLAIIVDISRLTANRCVGPQQQYLSALPPGTGAAYDDAMPDRDALKLKIQLLCGDEIAMGPGKADLLDAIAAQGSISAAARAMGMSYRRAWLLVDAMNRCWNAALVDTSPGRAKSSGATLSEAGRRVLDRYRRLQAVLDDTAHGDLLAGLAGELRRQPRSRAGDA
jgi:molybdate transport system regulatory protein